MRRYAERTTVSAEKSRVEIERTLRRYGAHGFSYGWEGANAQVMFKMEKRMVRFMLRLPAEADEEFARTPAGRPRSQKQRAAEWERASRQRWRALSLVIKAKLEAVESGITTFEEEFLAHILLRDGSTYGAHAIPAIAEHYEGGGLPALLPAPATGR